MSQSQKRALSPAANARLPKKCRCEASSPPPASSTQPISTSSTPPTSTPPIFSTSDASSTSTSSVDTLPANASFPSIPEVRCLFSAPLYSLVCAEHYHTCLFNNGSRVKIHCRWGHSAKTRCHTLQGGRVFYLQILRGLHWLRSLRLIAAYSQRMLRLGMCSALVPASGTRMATV
ncbi:uncharacterized protein EI90DRAFT_654694 [Cantharellus anzutake]|uniref:uncharacterized protein n=1 Tax=Cantharellus anzutake TaxID=1750568 RepID=UPI001906F7C9|nr:uncharacterized protein EI90DRAFT_654694 [Cantharellus anzutake]KAF8312613.1 hypothetical protein EI90DRAFT_654694 [Cantharellus anzutake]